MATVQQSLTFKPNVDEEGFLQQPESWNRDVAQVLAQGEAPGGLTEDHWKVIDYLRQFYLECDTVPPVRMVHRFTGFNLGYIYNMFPSGLTRDACRLCGIPRARIHGLYP